MIFIFSYECSDELALSYLEIFEDDVESAVDAFLESGPIEKQRLYVSQQNERANCNHHQPQTLLPRLEELRDDTLQAKKTSLVSKSEEYAFPTGITGVQVLSGSI